MGSGGGGIEFHIPGGPVVCVRECVCVCVRGVGVRVTLKLYRYT